LLGVLFSLIILCVYVLIGLSGFWVGTTLGGYFNEPRSSAGIQRDDEKKVIKMPEG
jgi:uncharacterized membrane protein YuzA (DUF378 family)